MPTPNGGTEPHREPLELNDVLNMEMHEGATLPFEVVGILEDPSDGESYAVLCHNADDEEEFIVTDRQGNLLEDEGVAQEILDDFLAYAEEEEAGRGAHNGETS